MRPLLIGIIVCSGAAISAYAQATYKTAKDFDWKIAQRLDSGRVVVMLTEEQAKISDDEGSALGPSIPKSATEFLAKFLNEIRPLPVEIGRRLTKNAIAPGDRWAIDTGRSGWFEASVEGFVLSDEGCSEVPAITANVASERLPAFARVRGKYFPAHAVSGWTLPAGNTGVGPSSYVVSENDRHDIEAVLRQAFERESPKILEKAARDSHAVGVAEMRDKYRRISLGRGKINFDVQAFRVTPDGLPRLFVRAAWNLDGRSVFFAGAWMRTTPVLEIEGLDLHSAEEQIWMDFKLDRPLDPSHTGEVLNIVDVDRDGLAEIVMLYHFYEGISIEVSKYPPTGPGTSQVIARYGSGC